MRHLNNFPEGFLPEGAPGENYGVVRVKKTKNETEGSSRYRQWFTRDLARCPAAKWQTWRARYRQLLRCISLPRKQWDNDDSEKLSCSIGVTFAKFWALPFCPEDVLTRAPTGTGTEPANFFFLSPSANRGQSERLALGFWQVITHKICSLAVN